MSSKQNSIRGPSFDDLALRATGIISGQLLAPREHKNEQGTCLARASSRPPARKPRADLAPHVSFIFWKEKLRLGETATFHRECVFSLIIALHQQENGKFRGLHWPMLMQLCNQTASVCFGGISHIQIF